MIELHDSWRQSPAVPPKWRAAKPPGALRKVRIHNTMLLQELRNLLPGRWVKVYRYGEDGTEIHYCEHVSGKVANVKHKVKY
jgi:hypothetical protein